MDERNGGDPESPNKAFRRALALKVRKRGKKRRNSTGGHAAVSRQEVPTEEMQVISRVPLSIRRMTFNVGMRQQSSVSSIGFDSLSNRCGGGGMDDFFDFPDAAFDNVGVRAKRLGGSHDTASLGSGGGKPNRFGVRTRLLKVSKPELIAWSEADEDALSKEDDSAGEDSLGGGSNGSSTTGRHSSERSNKERNNNCRRVTAKLSTVSEEPSAGAISSSDDDSGGPVEVVQDLAVEVNRNRKCQQQKQGDFSETLNAIHNCSGTSANQEKDESSTSSGSKVNVFTAWRASGTMVSIDCKTAKEAFPAMAVWPRFFQWPSWPRSTQVAPLVSGSP